MKAELVTETQTFVKCPVCGSGSRVDHLGAGRTFTRWGCANDDCDVTLSGTVCADGSIDMEVGKKEPQGIALLKLGDIYLLIRERYGRVENPDYFYHSHQCPTNLLGSADRVFSVDGVDTHGMIRFVASIPFDPETWKRLDQETDSLESLFAIFKTNGLPAPSEWPEENRGVIPWLAEMQREHRSKGDA